ncbi:MAG: hypothetical protein M0R46_13270 [Candidatus Muirbacterium halophilum]|nr:hypothetical protein [Candidatus Muirbacterium halophilum]
MSKISKYVKLDKDILLEYTYDSTNILLESYNILVDSRDRSQSYIATPTSVTNNILSNQLFNTDPITQKYSKVNTDYFSFLQLKEYASGTPTKYDTIKIHIPINWTFGEHLGFYIRVYAFDTYNQTTYDLSNFYYDMTDLSQQYLMNFTTPALLFQEKLWGKNITINIPSLNDLANQKINNLPKENSINANLTNGNGFNITSPIFIDFHFINNIQTLNGLTSYTLSSKVTTTVPQAPEFEKLGLNIEHSKNGDYFEIYGTYNNTISEFNNFINESSNIGHRYYVTYNVTMYEQNIRGKTVTYTQQDNFNETIDFRPIIKYSTTTAIIDVEMRLIDAVDNSYIIRRASYGMLQDEVSKYSLNMIKINISNANKPKIYNIKSNIDPSLVGMSNAMGNIHGKTKKTQRVTLNNNPTVKIETVKVGYPVLIDKYNIVGKSNSATFNNTIFYGMGKLMITLYPFDNIINFTIANGKETRSNILDLSGYGDIKLVFKNDSNTFSFPLFFDANSVNLSLGQLTFKIPESSFNDIKRMYNSGLNVFYITSEALSIKSIIYSGLFKIYDNINNITELNATVNTESVIIKDPDLYQETAIVTRKAISSETTPKLKSGINLNGVNIEDIKINKK